MKKTLADVIQSVVEVAGEAVESLEPVVNHFTYSGRDAYGPTGETMVARQGIVEDSNELVQGTDGRMVVAAAKVTFFESVTIKEGDVFAIPPSTRKIPFIKVNGMRKKDGNGHYLTEVWLGKTP